MSKLYVLHHTREFSEELSECVYGHSDTKQIGIFYSKNLCQSILEKYRKLEGFKDHPEGFQIDEYTIDSIYNEGVSRLIDQYKSKKSRQDSVYLLYFTREFDDGHDDSRLLGIFSGQQKAEEALAVVKAIPEIGQFSDQFEIYDDKVGRLGWTGGFFTHK